MGLAKVESAEVDVDFDNKSECVEEMLAIILKSTAQASETIKVTDSRLDLGIRIEKQSEAFNYDIVFKEFPLETVDSLVRKSTEPVEDSTVEIKLAAITIAEAADVTMEVRLQSKGKSDVGYNEETVELAKEMGTVEAVETSESIQLLKEFSDQSAQISHGEEKEFQEIEMTKTEQVETAVGSLGLVSNLVSSFSVDEQTKAEEEEEEETHLLVELNKIECEESLEIDIEISDRQSNSASIALHTVHAEETEMILNIQHPEKSEEISSFTAELVVTKTSEDVSITEQKTVVDVLLEKGEQKMIESVEIHEKISLKQAEVLTKPGQEDVVVDLDVSQPEETEQIEVAVEVSYAKHM